MCRRKHVSIGDEGSPAELPPAGLDYVCIIHALCTYYLCIIMCYLSVQWAAVSTCLLEMSVPPQNCLLPDWIMATIHGYSWESAAMPPTMRVVSRAFCPQPAVHRTLNQNKKQLKKKHFLNQYIRFCILFHSIKFCILVLFKTLNSVFWLNSKHSIAPNLGIEPTTPRLNVRGRNKTYKNSYVQQG